MTTNDSTTTIDSIWCPYEVNHFEKKGICNLCGLPKNEHITKKRYLKLKFEK
jgi:hypothetical protein